MKNVTKTINIAKDFSQYPIGRDDKDGPDSGERFRRDFLVPALKEYEKVSVFLDGPKGYGSSFLEEAFGGLVRKEGFKRQDLQSRLEITYKEAIYELYKNEAWEYIGEVVNPHSGVRV